MRATDQCDASRFLQREDQDEQQRQMHDQGIELLGGTEAQKQPTKRLNQQKQRAQDDDQPLLRTCCEAACYMDTEVEPENCHQLIIKYTQCSC